MKPASGRRDEAVSALAAQLLAHMKIGNGPETFMVQLTLRITAMCGRSHELVQALRTRMRHTLRPGGCSSAYLAADVDAPNVFWYCEDWSDGETLESELKTERFTQLLEVMESGAQSPVLEFRVLAEARGLEYVTATREKPARC